MSRYDDESAKGWKIAFTLVLIAFIVSLAWAITATSQKSSLQTKYNATSSKLNQYTSDNAQGQKQCIADAQSLFNAGAGIGANDATNLTAQVSACQVQYPTN